MNIKTNPKDRPDIWQLGECVFQIMKKPNPIPNHNQLEQINLTHVSSLPTQTQLNNLKLQSKNQPNKNQAQSSYVRKYSLLSIDQLEKIRIGDFCELI